MWECVLKLNKVTLKTHTTSCIQAINRTFVHVLKAPFSATELSIKREKMLEICEGCGQKIQDRYLMRVGELSWHEHCLSCCVCGCPLAHTCYTRNSKLYCKPDYDRYIGLTL